MFNVNPQAGPSLRPVTVRLLLTADFDDRNACLFALLLFSTSFSSAVLFGCCAVVVDRPPVVSRSVLALCRSVLVLALFRFWFLYGIYKSTRATRYAL